MKKIISIILAIMIIPIVIAQEAEVDAGTTPDAPFIYGIDIWWDDVRVNFAGTDAEKARVRLEVAEERAAEMEQMMNQNKIQYMNQAKLQQQKQIQECEKLQQNMNDADRNMIQQRLQKHIQTLERVLAKAPEAAKEGLQNAIQNSEKSFERNQERISTQNRISVKEMEKNIESGEVKITNQIKTSTSQGGE